MKQIKQRFFLLFALGSFIMFGALAQTNTWNGNTDTDWHKTCNWSLNLIPTCAHDVVIPTVTSYPSITGIAHCNTISITSAAANTLTVNSAGGARLDVGLGGSCSGTPTSNSCCTPPVLSGISGLTAVASCTQPAHPNTCGGTLRWYNDYTADVSSDGGSPISGFNWTWPACANGNAWTCNLPTYPNQSLDICFGDCGNGVFPLSVTATNACGTSAPVNINVTNSGGSCFCP